MRVSLLVLGALTLASPLGAALVEPPIPLGHGFFCDFGETCATVEFSFDGGCNTDGTVTYLRHFLSQDKLRTFPAHLSCTDAGPVQVQEWTSPDPFWNFHLVGAGAPGTLVAVAGTFRDGYTAVWFAGLA